jgi:nucleotide-binding universal stress UspA family protein
MTRMLVPTDFSERSLEAVRYAVEYTYAVGRETLLLHVVEAEPLRSYTVGRLPDALAYGIDAMGNILPSPVPQKLIHRDLGEEAQWKLPALLPPGDRDRFRTLVTVGKAAAEIVRVARDQKADLIVMGTPARRGLRRFLRTGVADQVIRKASIPVITVDATQQGLGRDSGRASLAYQHAYVAGGRFRGKKTEPSFILASGIAGSLLEEPHERAEDPLLPQHAMTCPRCTRDSSDED